MAEVQLLQKSYDDLYRTHQRIMETIREHDGQLERDGDEVAYWEARRQELSSQ